MLDAARAVRSHRARLRLLLGGEGLGDDTAAGVVTAVVGSVLGSVITDEDVVRAHVQRRLPISLIALARAETPYDVLGVLAKKGVVAVPWTSFETLEANAWRVRDLYERRGLSTAQVAFRFGVSRRALAVWLKTQGVPVHLGRELPEEADRLERLRRVAETRLEHVGSVDIVRRLISECPSPPGVAEAVGRAVERVAAARVRRERHPLTVRAVQDVVAEVRARGRADVAIEQHGRAVLRLLDVGVLGVAPDWDLIEYVERLVCRASEDDRSRMAEILADVADDLRPWLRPEPEWQTPLLPPVGPEIDHGPCALCAVTEDWSGRPLRDLLGRIIDEATVGFMKTDNYRLALRMWAGVDAPFLTGRAIGEALGVSGGRALQLAHRASSRVRGYCLYPSWRHPNSAVRAAAAAVAAVGGAAAVIEDGGWPGANNAALTELVEVLDYVDDPARWEKRLSP